MNIIHSSPLLRCIWQGSYHQAVSIDFWAGHVLTDGEQFYTYSEHFQFLPGEQSYHDRPPRLVYKKEHKQVDKEKLRQLAIRRFKWATQQKLAKGYSVVLELHEYLLTDLDEESFDRLFEEAQEAVQLLKEEEERRLDEKYIFALCTSSK
jgi:hypothetical protein